MAICLECACPDARVAVTRTVVHLDELVQVRTVVCPHCGIRGQLIRDTGPAIKRDMDHKKDPTGSRDSTGNRINGA